MRRSTLVLIAALLVLAGCLAVAPARAHAAPPGARATAAHTYSSDPFIGNWSHDKLWFKVRAPVDGRYRVTWHNSNGTSFSYYVARLSDTIYYDVQRHRNTYTVASSGAQLRAHYLTTKHHYVNVTFGRVQ